MDKSKYKHRDAPETKVDFSYKECSPNAKLATTKDLEDIKVYESVTVRGLVLLGDNTAEQVPTKPGPKKLEGCFLDESGNIKIAIWNEQIEQIENNKCYEIENIPCDRTLARNTCLLQSTCCLKKLRQTFQSCHQTTFKRPKMKL